jgi:hypothetical protein
LAPDRRPRPGDPRDRPHPEQGYRSCLGLLRLSKRYGEDRLEAACTRAVAVGARSLPHVDSMLKHGLDRLALRDLGADIVYESLASDLDRDALEGSKLEFRSAIVNESFAKRNFGSKSPIGARVGFGDRPRRRDQRRRSLSTFQPEHECRVATAC